MTEMELIEHLLIRVFAAVEASADIIFNCHSCTLATVTYFEWHR